MLSCFVLSYQDVSSYVWIKSLPDNEYNGSCYQGPCATAAVLAPVGRIIIIIIIN